MSCMGVFVLTLLLSIVEHACELNGKSQIDYMEAEFMIENDRLKMST